MFEISVRHFPFVSLSYLHTIVTYKWFITWPRNNNNKVPSRVGGHSKTQEIVDSIIVEGRYENNGGTTSSKNISRSPFIQFVIYVIDVHGWMKEARTTMPKDALEAKNGVGFFILFFLSAANFMFCLICDYGFLYLLLRQHCLNMEIWIWNKVKKDSKWDKKTMTQNARAQKTKANKHPRSR